MQKAARDLFIRMNLGMWATIIVLSFAAFSILYTTLWELSISGKKSHYDLINMLVEKIF